MSVSAGETLSRKLAVEIVGFLYRSMLDREPDPAGLAYYVDWLESGHGSIDEIERAFANSPEYMASADSDRLSQGHAIGEDDLLAKYLQFPGGASAYLLLPAASADPIVTAYRRGEMPNNYMLDLLLQFSTAGDKVVDLGCHVGSFSIGAAAMGRKVLAVDAAQNHVDWVGQSAKLNGFRDVATCCAAIAADFGKRRFLSNGLYGRLDYAGDAAYTTEVPARPLAAILTAFAFEKLRFLKMDIEGGEMDALVSGANMLRAFQPAILFESNAASLKEAGYSVPVIRQTLEELGYRTFRVEGDALIYAPPDQIQPEIWVDLIALGTKDQALIQSRIRWQWDRQDILERCGQWSKMADPSVRQFLREQIVLHGMEGDISGEAAVSLGL